MLLWLALFGVMVAGVGVKYVREMRRAYGRIEGRSVVLGTTHGDVEYAEGGSGANVLVVHGSGGGFDQGQLLAETIFAGKVHWIAPSRFGYLRSTFLPGATFTEQAHAFAALLDHLKIARVAVVALSHGGPSALLFAALYPERVSSLTLISAGVASSGEAAQAAANEKGNALTFVFQGDVRYWALTTAFRGWFLELMGVTKEVIGSLTPEQRELAGKLVEGMNPVSPRAAGVRFDNRAAMPNERIAAIAAPTLIVHAKDDTLQLFRHAEYAARHIGKARLVAFEKGGHLVLAVELEKIRALVAEQVRQGFAGEW